MSESIEWIGMFSEKQKGEFAAYGAAILWSLFPIVTVVTVSALPSLFTAAISTGLSSLFFAVTLTWRKEWKKAQSAEVWRDMLLTTLFIGIIFYGLVFTGYRFTSPGNGAMVGLMEVFFAFVIINLLWKHERFIPVHALGALLMVIGALFVLIPKGTVGLNVGDLLILLATVSAPIGNIYAQRARKAVTADMIMFVRSIISAVFLMVLAWLLEPIPSFQVLASVWWFLLLNGIVLMGLTKILWIEAIHRLPIAKTVALTEVEVLLTLVFAYLLLGQTITPEQAMGILPMLGGVFLLTRPSALSL